MIHTVAISGSYLYAIICTHKLLNKLPPKPK
jgi:hypothetical protein